MRTVTANGTRPDEPGWVSEHDDDAQRPTEDDIERWAAAYEASRFNPSRPAGPTAAIPPLPSTVPTVERHAPSLIDWDELWTAEHSDDDWLLEPFIAKGRQHSVYAPAKAGKSLFVLYCVAQLATGQACLDSLGGEPARVLYLDFEMTPDDLRERLADMGYGPDRDLSNLYYHSLPSLPPLDTPGGGIEVCELAEHYQADLVIVDTLSRVLVGAENDSDTLRAFYTHTGRPLKAAGRALARLDHAGKDLTKGQRGTSAKTDDVDIVWRLLPRDRGRFDLEATHRRMGWVPSTVHLEQKDRPLRYEVAADTWPEGTRTVVDALDALNVDPALSRRKVETILREHDHGVSSLVVSTAIRFRRQRMQRGEPAF